MRRESLPPLAEELFALFETTGNRLKYEEVYFVRRKFLAVFGITAYLFKQQEDIKKLEEVLLEICAEECWALPAHVNRKDNPEWRNTVDLFAAETAQALAEIVTLAGERLQLSDEVRRAVYAETEQRVLIPFEQNRQGFEGADHNWNAVCCGSIGSAAIYLLAGKEEERLNTILQRICNSLECYLDGFREDGACMEGIGYFTYGMTYFTGFAEQLLRYSNGEINLFAKDKVRKIAEFQQKMYFSCGQTVSFSDGDTKARFRMGLTSYLARQYDTVRMPDVVYAADFETDSCYRFMGLLRDVLWTKERTEAKEPVALFRHDVFWEAQWSICESKTKTGFAIKGGNNAEPHNHNDVGSFLYVVSGEQLLCDLGAGEYTASYFGEGRYDILCNSSKGHSVPVLYGEFQQAGAGYAASLFEADGKGRTRVEFAGAYAAGVAERVIRETEFSLEDGTLMVQDDFLLFPASEARKGPAITETLVTKGQVCLKENSAIITGKQSACRVIIEGRTENLRVTEQVHSNHGGEPEVVRLIQWEVIPEEKGAGVYGVSKYFIWG